MKSLDRNSLEEQTRLVSRYVAGDLSRSERAEFEAWLVASPELAAEVEMERRLRRGIASAARRGWLKRGAPVQPVRDDRRWQIAARRQRRAGAWRSSSASWRTARRTRASPAASRRRGDRKPTSLPVTVRLGNVRGAGGAPDVSVSLTRCSGRAGHRAGCRRADLRGRRHRARMRGRQRAADAAVRRIRDGSGQSPRRDARLALIAPGAGGDARSCRSRCAIPAASTPATTTSSCAGIRPITRKSWRDSGSASVAQ